MIIVCVLAGYLFVGWCISLYCDVKATKVPTWKDFLITMVFWLPLGIAIAFMICAVAIALRGDSIR